MAEPWLSAEEIDAFLGITKLKQNSEQFITEAGRLITGPKASVVVEYVTYNLLDGRYDSAIFIENQTDQDLSVAGDKLKNSVYEYLATESRVECSFVERSTIGDEVAIYLRPPRGFFIPTPVCDYNPDWAITSRDNVTNIKHLYFVAKTSGSMFAFRLKGVENAKIECARKFIASLDAKADHGGVRPDVVDSYNSLLQFTGV